MEHQPKISTVEAFIMIIIGIIADILSIFPGINILVGISMAGMMFYLKNKGIMSIVNLIAYIAEYIPLLSILPLYSAGLIATIIIDRNPKLSAAVEKAALAKGVKTPVGGLKKTA